MYVVLFLFITHLKKLEPKKHNAICILKKKREKKKQQQTHIVTTHASKIHINYSLINTFKKEINENKIASISVRHTAEYAHDTNIHIHIQPPYYKF